jgi:hypothetical protein
MTDFRFFQSVKFAFGASSNFRPRIVVDGNTMDSIERIIPNLNT